MQTHKHMFIIPHINVKSGVNMCVDLSCGHVCWNVAQQPVGQSVGPPLQHLCRVKKDAISTYPQVTQHTGLTPPQLDWSCASPTAALLPLLRREASFKDDPKETSRTVNNQAETPDPRKDALSCAKKKQQNKTLQNNRKQQQSRHEAVCPYC